MKGEGMVDQGVMLVCARYFATCHRVEKCEIFFITHQRPYASFAENLVTVRKLRKQSFYVRLFPFRD